MLLCTSTHCFARRGFAATHGQECGTVLVTGLGRKNT